VRRTGRADAALVNNGAASTNFAVVNNGAAGMPDFSGELSRPCTRIATTPAPGAVLHEQRLGDVFIALLPLACDAPR